MNAETCECRNCLNTKIIESSQKLNTLRVFENNLPSNCSDKQLQICLVFVNRINFIIIFCGKQFQQCC